MRCFLILLLIAVAGCDGTTTEIGPIHAQALPPCGDAPSGDWEQGFGAPLDDMDPLVTDVATTADGVVVVGWISQTSTDPLAVRFGGEWRDVPVDPENRNLRRVVVLADGSIVLGGAKITRSDGSSWTAIAEHGLSTTGKMPLLADADGALYFVVLGTGESEVMRWQADAIDSLGVLDFEVGALAIVDEELVAAGVEPRGEAWPSRISILRDGGWESLDMIPGNGFDGIDQLVVAPPHGVFVRSFQQLMTASTLDGPWNEIDLGLVETEAIAACDGGLFAAWRVGDDEDVPQRVQLSFFDGTWHEMGEDQLGRVPGIAPAPEGVYLAGAEDTHLLFWRW
jgi:hypothetical protein